MKNLPKCLACDSTENIEWASAKDAEYLTTNETFQFYRCENCHVLFIDPVPSERLNIIYPQNYYSFVTPKTSIIFAIKNWLDRRIFKRLFAQIPGESLNVLDVGGGAGWQLNNLRRIEPRITQTYLVDLDPNAEKLARKHGHEYFCGGIENYETNIKFDFVLLLNLIEHVKDPTKVLVKLRSMLSDKGIVLVKTPNYDALDAQIFRHKNWAGYHCPRHWVLFTKNSFENLAKRAGLHVKYFSYTQGAPFWAASFLSWLSKIGMVNITKERPIMYHPLFGFLSAGFAFLDFVRRPFAKTSQMFFMLTTKP
jgi:2-polyprenyl-3-methyl-5-hydroxy-6-metoxy-1,4-benzoquinol methylase